MGISSMVFRGCDCGDLCRCRTRLPRAANVARTWSTKRSLGARIKAVPSRNTVSIPLPHFAAVAIVMLLIGIMIGITIADLGMF